MHPPNYPDQFLALYRQTKRIIQAIARAQGLTPVQLVALTHADRTGPLPMSDLTDLLDTTRGAVTGLVDRLEQAGNLQRQPSPTDRRVILLVMTDKGRDTLRRARSAWREHIQAWIQRLPAAHHAELSRALDQLLSHAPAFDNLD